MEASPLGRLSSEIRNQIYHLALYERRPVAITTNYWIEPALTRTCSQIRQECLFMFYAINEFTTIVTSFSMGEPLLLWLQQVSSEKTRFISCLHVRVEAPGFEFEGSSSSTDTGTERSLDNPVFAALRSCDFGGRAPEKIVTLTANGVDDKPTLWDMVYGKAETPVGNYFARMALLSALYPQEMSTAFKENRTMAKLEKLLALDARLQTRRGYPLQAS